MSIYKSKTYICKNCSCKFKIDVECPPADFNDFRLDFKPIGHEKLIFNFVNYILSFDEYCSHDITEEYFTNDHDVIGIDTYLKNRAEEFLKHYYDGSNYKKVSILYLFASWFNKEPNESYKFLEEASGYNLQYILFLNINNGLFKQDVLYDLIFLDVHRRLDSHSDYRNSIANLIKYNIYNENSVETNFNEFDIDIILKIVDAQVSLLSNGNINILTLKDLGVDYLDCFILINNFLKNKDTFS